MNSDRITQAAAILTQDKKVNTRWQWDDSKPHWTGPKPIASVTDRSWKLLGMTVLDYWPGKDKPDGWSILWHKWNKGLTLSYIPPVVGTHQECIKHEDATTITLQWIDVPNKPGFWQKHLPRGFSFTIAKLNGKWRMNRHYDPFMRASLDAAPLVSIEEWKQLGSGGETIYDSVDDLPEADKAYQAWLNTEQVRKAARSS